MALNQVVKKLIVQTGGVVTLVCLDWVKRLRGSTPNDFYIGVKVSNLHSD